MTKVFAKVMEKEVMPDEWRSSTFIPVLKKKGAYRTVELERTQHYLAYPEDLEKKSWTSN